MNVPLEIDYRFLHPFYHILFTTCFIAIYCSDYLINLNCIFDFLWNSSLSLVRPRLPHGSVPRTSPPPSDHYYGFPSTCLSAKSVHKELVFFPFYFLLACPQIIFRYLLPQMTTTGMYSNIKITFFVHINLYKMISTTQYSQTQSSLIYMAAAVWIFYRNKQKAPQDGILDNSFYEILKQI